MCELHACALQGLGGDRAFALCLSLSHTASHCGLGHNSWCCTRAWGRVPSLSVLGGQAGHAHRSVLSSSSPGLARVEGHTPESYCKVLCFRPPSLRHPGWGTLRGALSGAPGATHGGGGGRVAEGHRPSQSRTGRCTGPGLRQAWGRGGASAFLPSPSVTPGLGVPGSWSQAPKPRGSG